MMLMMRSSVMMAVDEATTDWVVAVPTPSAPPEACMPQYDDAMGTAAPYAMLLMQQTKISA